jgi:hypothetical protein
MSQKNVDKVTKAFVYEIEANSVDSHQSTPGYVVTFVRFQNRDPFHFGKDPSFLETRDTLCVISDLVQLNVRDQKGQPNMSCDFLAKAGEINYQAALAPGDYMLVNMLEDQSHILDIRDRALKGQPINGIKDGFKGVFRVQSVHTTQLVDPVSGSPTMGYQVTAYSHTELNDVIYFNPYLVTQGEKTNDVLFLTTISSQWNNLIANKQINSVQNVIKLLFQAFLGRGLNKSGLRLREGIVRSENNLYLLPPALGKLLDHPKATTAADIVNMYLGIQQYAAGSAATPPKTGLNPTYRRDGNFVHSGSPIKGHSYNKPEYWNQIPVQQILRNYLNDVVNEMYTTVKPDPDSGSVMPAIVIRQKPFTSETFKQSDVTRFLSLPRWRIHPDRILTYHIGRDEAARINFVQIFGRSQALEGNAQAASIDQQIASGNYSVDREDIKRSGLKPYIATSNFDYPSSGSSARLSQTPAWAKLVGDWLIGGHLKMSGSVECSGIEDPICVGDNVQVDGCVFHIEAVSHTMSVSGAEGKLSFRTQVAMSSGVPSEAYSGQGRFIEMNQGNADRRRAEIAAEGLDTLIPQPGVSDTQDVPGRVDGEKGVKQQTVETKPFSPEAASIDSKPKQTGGPGKAKARPVKIGRMR